MTQNRHRSFCLLERQMSRSREGGQEEVEIQGGLLQDLGVRGPAEGPREVRAGRKACRDGSREGPGDRFWRGCAPKVVPAQSPDLPRRLNESRLKAGGVSPFSASRGPKRVPRPSKNDSGRSAKTDGCQLFW